MWIYIYQEHNVFFSRPREKSYLLVLTFQNIILKNNYNFYIIIKEFEIFFNFHNLLLNRKVFPRFPFFEMWKHYFLPCSIIWVSQRTQTRRWMCDLVMAWIKVKVTTNVFLSEWPNYIETNNFFLVCTVVGCFTTFKTLYHLAQFTKGNW